MVEAKENYLCGHFRHCKEEKPHFPHANGHYQGNCGELEYICSGVRGGEVNFVVTQSEEGSPEYPAEFGWVVVNPETPKKNELFVGNLTVSEFIEKAREYSSYSKPAVRRFFDSLVEDYQVELEKRWAFWSDAIFQEMGEES